MPEKKEVSIKQLSLDLRNFRTVEQANESEAVRAMISTRPEWFWALTDSLLDSGFLPTENVIVLKVKQKELSVREGNRRVAAIKLIHGEFQLDDLSVPDDIASRIQNVDPGWLKANETVPCVLYEASEVAVVNRIVRLAHGKNEKAGRDQWNAVARARHNRSENKATEPALDLLEKYLREGRNLTDLQASRWSGEYPLSVLEDAMKKLAPRLQHKDAPSLASAYPSIKYREPVERLIHDIGMKILTFPSLRSGDSIADTYGIPAAQPTGGATGGASGGSASGKSGGGSASGSKASGKTAGVRPKPKAIAINDPKSATKALRGFQPRGKNRDKLAALREEAILLKVEQTPMAFCFVLRSMFELSAKAYVEDHKSKGGPPLKDAKGRDKTLAHLLKDIKNHLVGSGATKDKALEKALHGASTELSSPHGFLSVTSLNQLIHHQSFSVAPNHIAVMFGNVFPLLEAMNS